jgi:hypothetical protein
VGGHLYRIFPKLGLTGRAQLRKALNESIDSSEGARHARRSCPGGLHMSDKPGIVPRAWRVGGRIEPERRHRIPAGRRVDHNGAAGFRRRPSPTTSCACGKFCGVRPAPLSL